MKIWQMTLPALVVLVIVAVLAGLCSEEGGARTITVDDDGEGDYATIQEAVDAAEDGDTIQVWEGSYFEVEITKGLRIVGNGTEETRIEMPGMYANATSIENVTVLGWIHLLPFVQDVVIRNCSVKGIQWGLVSTNNRNVTLADCNIMGASEDGVHIKRLSESNFINCSFRNCRTGMLIEEGTNNRIEGCTFLNNTGSGIYLIRTRSTWITNCVFEGNKIGISDSRTEDTSLRNNHFKNNGRNVVVTRAGGLSQEEFICYFVIIPTLAISSAVGMLLAKKDKFRNKSTCAALPNNEHKK